MMAPYRTSQNDIELMKLSAGGAGQFRVRRRQRPSGSRRHRRRRRSAIGGSAHGISRRHGGEECSEIVERAGFVGPQRRQPFVGRRDELPLFVVRNRAKQNARIGRIIRFVQKAVKLRVHGFRRRDAASAGSERGRGTGRHTGRGCRRALRREGSNDKPRSVSTRRLTERSFSDATASAVRRSVSKNSINHFWRVIPSIFNKALRTEKRKEWIIRVRGAHALCFRDRWKCPKIDVCVCVRERERERETATSVITCK